MPTFVARLISHPLHHLFHTVVHSVIRKYLILYWRPGRKTQPKNSTLYPPTHSCGYFFNISGQHPMLATDYATNSSMSTQPLTPQMHFLWRLFRLQTPEYPNNSWQYWNGSLRFQIVALPIVDFVTVSSASTITTYKIRHP
jgi:hypothetical protein